MSLRIHVLGVLSQQVIVYKRKPHGAWASGDPTMLGQRPALGPLAVSLTPDPLPLPLLVTLTLLILRGIRFRKVGPHRAR